MKIRLDPVNDFTPETLDRIAIPHRDKVARAMLNMHVRADSSFIVGIDGDWGSGKTVFLHRLEQLARADGVRVCYFDAFEADISEDAFISIASTLSNFIKNEFGDEPQDRFLETVARAGATLVTSLGRKSISNLSAGLLDEDLQKELVEAAKLESSNYKEIKALIRTSSNRQIAVKALRDLIDKTVSNKDDNARIIFIVDELDRCRPEFAIETLECIKHIFSASHINFIIGANFEQLGRIFSHKYGIADGNSRYFEKFLDIRHKLVGRFDDGTSGHKNALQSIRSSMEGSDHKLNNFILDLLAEFFSVNAYSIRTWIKTLETYNLATLQVKNIEPELLAPLALVAALKCIEYRLYNMWLKGASVRAEIDAVFSVDTTLDEYRDLETKLKRHVESSFFPEYKNEERYLRNAVRELLELGLLGESNA